MPVKMDSGFRRNDGIRQTPSLFVIPAKAGIQVLSSQTPSLPSPRRKPGSILLTFKSVESLKRAIGFKELVNLFFSQIKAKKKLHEGGAFGPDVRLEIIRVE